MTDTTKQPETQPATRDAAANAAEREKSTPSGEAPVKQHNPGDQGLNPDQRGPAQPSGNDDAGKAGNA